MRNPLQLVLDFLSPPRETVPSPFDKTQVTPASVTPPKSGVSRSLVHPSTQVELPGEVSIAHPRANRETVLEGMRVAYLFQRVRRRSIGFLVGPDGLEVRAPKWVTLKEVCFIADVAVLPRWMRVRDALDFVAGTHPKFDRSKADLVGPGQNRFSQVNICIWIR